jgi:DNA-binding response OmpR family regulator
LRLYFVGRIDRAQEVTLVAERHVASMPMPSSKYVFGGGSRLMLVGRRILVVHAEAMIGHRIASMLDGAGAEIVGPAHELGHALRCAAEPDLSAAVLNYVFHGGDTRPIAERLHARGVPIVFFTAMEPGFMAQVAVQFGAVVLSNPAEWDRIVTAVTDLCQF